MKQPVQTLYLLLAMMSSGCGTMVSHFGDCGSTPPAGVYKGVVFDAQCVAAPFSGHADMIGYVPIGLLDFPFSLTADTIIFPFDLADYESRRKNN